MIRGDGASRPRDAIRSNRAALSPQDPRLNAISRQEHGDQQRIRQNQQPPLRADGEDELADGPPAFVLKVYPEALQWKMRKEILVARLLDGRLGVPTPHILLADDSKGLIDLNFLVMNRFDGQSVIRWEPTLNPSDCHAIYAQMGRVLRDIHGIAIDSFGYIGPDGVVAPSNSNRVSRPARRRKSGTVTTSGAAVFLARSIATGAATVVGPRSGVSNPAG